MTILIGILETFGDFTFNGQFFSFSINYRPIKPTKNVVNWTHKFVNSSWSKEKHRRYNKQYGRHEGSSVSTNKPNITCYIFLEANGHIFSLNLESSGYTESKNTTKTTTKRYRTAWMSMYIYELVGDERKRNEELVKEEKDPSVVKLVY